MLSVGCWCVIQIAHTQQSTINMFLYRRCHVSSYIWLHVVPELGSCAEGAGRELPASAYPAMLPQLLAPTSGTARRTLPLWLTTPLCLPDQSTVPPRRAHLGCLHKQSQLVVAHANLTLPLMLLLLNLHCALNLASGVGNAGWCLIAANPRPP